MNLINNFIEPSPTELSFLNKSNHSQMFFEIGVLRNFAKFTGKDPYWSLFSVKFY